MSVAISPEMSIESCYVTILSRQLLLALLAGLALALPKNRNLTLALTKPVDIDHTHTTPLLLTHTLYSGPPSSSISSFRPVY